MRLFMTLATLLIAAALVAADDKAKDDAKDEAQTSADAKAKDAPKPAAQEWRPLFDGKTLAGWKTAQFGAHAEPEVKDGQLVLPTGDPLTGATRAKDDVPHVNYEIELEAQRAEGGDFFVGLTFPVLDSHASLILGGWSGGVCGISSIDGFDASENSTSSFRQFKNKQWYKVRLRVLKDRLQAWVDDENIVDVDTEGKTLSIRVEVDPSRPLGFATYRTTAALRNIRIRELKPEEVKASDAEQTKNRADN